MGRTFLAGRKQVQTQKQPRTRCISLGKEFVLFF